MPRAIAFDPNARLPWLSDPMRPQPRQPRRSWVPLVVAVSLSGAIAYGGWTLVQRTSESAPQAAESGYTVPLPQPQPALVQPAEPEAASANEREALRPVAAEPITRMREKPAASPRSSSQARRSAPPRDAGSNSAAPAYDPRAWRSGIPGRIIQLGAFATSAKAQSEWRRVYARYPLLRPLSPRVMRSKIRGRTYYRLQLGTFSQAHSELLCQRLRATGQGCIVLGLRRNRR